MQKADFSSKPTILLVDDTPDNIALLSALLKDQYKLKIATNGVKALQIAGVAPCPDLILLDVMMPEMDGHETCRRLKANAETADIPVIFLTAKTQPEDEELGFSLGAADYISKPISPPIVLARVGTQLKLRKAQQLLKDQNRHLEHLVAERTRQLTQMQQATILAIASLAENRNNESGHDLRRLQAYVKALALRLRERPRFAAQLSDANIDLIVCAAPLHDIGQIVVPDRILLKPGRLDADEFEIMKQHTVHGRDVILAMQAHLGADSGFLNVARDIAYAHQERWDGSGYPEGRKGEEIPLAARIVALVDVYDALTSRRVYKAACSHEEAVAIVRQGRGIHFDPDIVDAFLTLEAEFLAIAADHRETVDA